MPVQVVGGDVQHGGNVWALLPDFQLEAGQLLYHHIFFTHLVQIGDERTANIAPYPGATSGHLAHHASQGGGGRFTRRTGNTDGFGSTAAHKFL